MTAPSLSPTQVATLAAIRSFTADHEVPPTVRELAGVCGVAYTTMWERLARLQDKGLVVREPRRHRGVWVV